MDWLAFAGSVLGGLIGGLFTFFGVKLTLKHDNEKKNQERIEKATQERPRLEITSYKDFNKTANIKTINNDCNVLALGVLSFKKIDGRACFFYNEAALDNKNLVFVEYQFVNSGLTEIEDICVTSNLPRNMSLFEYEKKDFYINECLLNYDVWSSKRYIKPKATFTLRVYYVKDQKPSTILNSPELVVWLRDVNGFVWSQTLNSPANEIENSKLSNSKALREARDISKAIECFNNPIMW